jgi:hypothetical protein
MTYVKQYQDVYANAVRTTAMAEQATTLRSPAATGLGRHHHRLLQCLSHQEYWSYAEIKATASHVYRFESGLAAALTRLVEKGLLRRLDRAVYQMSAEGKRVAATAYCAYRDLAAALGVSTRTAHRLINPPNKRHTVSRTVPVDTNLLRLVGYYLAEGSVGAQKQKGKKDCLYQTEFSFGKQEKERRYAQDVCVAAQALGFHARMGMKDGCHHVVINSRHLAQFLVDHFGRGAAHKTIPAWVLALPAAKLAPLVTAYLNGDGHRRRHSVSATTVSRQLAYSLAQAANKIGYRSSIRRCAPVRPQSMETAHDCYIVTLYRGTGTKVFADADYLYLPVTGRVRLQYAGPVYNLAVDEDQSYCTTYHSVHNCSRLGLSRRLPSTLDFSRLTPASRILLIHARARVENASLYGSFPCPKTLHEPGSDACIGAWWEDVDGGTAVPGSTDPRAVTRTMPSFTYRARRRPDGLTPRYVPGFFASFPASRLAVVKGGDSRALVAALKARLPVTEVDA